LMGYEKRLQRKKQSLQGWLRSILNDNRGRRKPFKNNLQKKTRVKPTPIKNYAGLNIQKENKYKTAKMLNVKKFKTVGQK